MDIRTKEESISLFKKLELKCKNDGILLLNKYDQKHDNFIDFISDFILNLNYVGSHIYTIDTEGNKTCSYNKNRSLEDLYRLVLGYFPDTDILDLAKYLVSNEKNPQLECINCNDINKIVFFNKKITNYYSGFRSELQHESISIPDSRYFKTKDGIIFHDYLNLIN